MNCKPGDLAIRIKAPTNSSIPSGSLVRILKFCGEAMLHAKRGKPERRGNVWDVEFRGNEVNPNTGFRFGIPDEELRPIRPDESHEESTEAMRLLTQLPQKEKV